MFLSISVESPSNLAIPRVVGLIYSHVLSNIQTKEAIPGLDYYTNVLFEMSFAESFPPVI